MMRIARKDRVKPVCTFAILFVALAVFAVSVRAQELRFNDMVVTVTPESGAIAIKDARSGLTFEQSDADKTVAAHSFKTDGATMNYLLAVGNRTDGNRTDGIRATLSVLPNRQVELTLAGDEMKTPVAYPPCWKLRKDDELLLPIGAGVLWPVTLAPELDASCFTLGRTPFWSRNLSMGMWGVMRDGARRWMVNAIRDASDAVFELPCVDRTLTPKFRWTPELGKWGYARTIRFMMGETGGLTAACKAYRAFRVPDGFGVSLREKAKSRPQLERLAGAANIWLWHDDYATLMYGTTTEPIAVENIANIKRIAGELKAAGVDRVLWGLFFQNDAPVAPWLKKECGYLVTKYDNYQDVMPDELQKVIPKHRVECCDFTARRGKNWPKDIGLDPNGKYQLCWKLYGTDGKLHSQHAMCTRQAAPYIRDEVGRDAKQYGYEARFIDCMGTHLRTCSSAAHPMTRRQSRSCGLANFKTLGELGLLAGTEEGIECYLAGLDYTEGKQSVFPYRIEPQMCWRWKSDYYEDADGRKAAYLARYMLNPLYRVPLWYLVYHECSVEYWYWGDSCNNVPSAMPRRDLFNALYGTPPLYSFKTKDWPFLKDKIVASYKRSTETARRVCFEEMTSFEYLTEDRLVQKTVFADGTAVIVNFSNGDYKRDGVTVKPLDYRVVP